MILIAVVVCSAPTPAWGTCASECCNENVKLAGWSQDGKTWATIVTWYVRQWIDPKPYEGVDKKDIIKTNQEVWQQLVVYSPKGVLKRLGRFPEGSYCAPDGLSIPYKRTSKYTAAERINVATFPALKKYKLIRPNKTWRKTFDARLEIKIGKRRRFRKLPGMAKQSDRCTSWELWDRKMTPTGLVAYFPRRCDFETRLASASVRGGMLHPNSRIALVKVKYHLEGYASKARYEPIVFKP